MDAKGKVSTRQAVELSSPQPYHFCIDVSELEPQDQYFLQQELEVLEKNAKEARELILEKYGVSKNYRFFNPDNMTDLVEEN